MLDLMHHSNNYSDSLSTETKGSDIRLASNPSTAKTPMHFFARGKEGCLATNFITTGPL